MKIKTTNTEAIESALAAVNGKATAHTITDAREITDLVARAERRLSALPKKDQVGVTVRHRSAGPTAKSYKYSATVTVVEVTRYPSGWFLTLAGRETVWPSPSGGVFTAYYLAPEQKSILVAATFGDIWENSDRHSHAA